LHGIDAFISGDFFVCIKPDAVNLFVMIGFENPFFGLIINEKNLER